MKGNDILNQITAAERFANDVFGNSWINFIDISFEELDEHYKTYASLRKELGKIVIRVSTRVNIKALVQWARDLIRTGKKPQEHTFSLDGKATLLQRIGTHQHWLDNASAMVKAAIPLNFDEKSSWVDWKVTFYNFLKTQPGRSGIPLAYIIRDEDDSPNSSQDLFDNYIRNAPLDGNAYISDARSVHLYLMKLICGNKVAEQRVLPTRCKQDGRIDYQALVNYYEGVGAKKISIREAEKDVCNLYYTGERHPHMWWARVETKIINAFAVIDKEYGYPVYPDLAKLRILQRMVRCDSLKTIKATINYQMSIKDRTIDFTTALANYRNAVDSNISNSINTKRSHRSISTSMSARPSYETQDEIKGSWTVNGIDGKEIKVHPKIRFSRQQWFNIPMETRKRLKQMRDEYKAKRSKQNKRSAKEVNIGGNGKESVNQEVEQEHRSLMGGKAERLRSKNISNVRSHRIVAKATPIQHEPIPGTIAQNEADTNADTCCLGSNFIALSQSNRSADVHPYSDQ